MVRQQTPKPDAQLPDAEAPVLDSHSVEVTQIPKNWVFDKGLHVLFRVFGTLRF